MKKIRLVLVIFFIYAIFFNAFDVIAANSAVSPDVELGKKIIGLWQMHTKDNDIQFLFREDKVLQVVVTSKDTGGVKINELYYMVKNNLLLTNISTGERWKVFFIKKIESRNMTLFDLTSFAKNGEIDPLLDMIKRGDIEIIKEGKGWEFSRK
ncbi:hypothetical protein HZB04_00350 [Candidatus Wolfebacteria bacterium]|nr:hypothetical protein [Candidatus Wolfebacteria bacterium]